ncbi:MULTISPECIES: Fic family protein [Glaesserella]|uniref:protein adenylyltransferase n=1 Tax=Glaesserella australis TaxID=2094024 RepID=A0A328C1J5_9PAST|nr:MULTISPECIES: Fic family protein [Glaesserella]AUI67170.1 cell filamentation protein [Glaesserella sp. 15-184]RAL18374.1 cell filamentation protein [Glaesserella australis]
MNNDPFNEYLRHIEADKKEKGYAWQTAIGLQDVDGLKPSAYLIETAIKNIEGEISLETAEQWISRYYEAKSPSVANNDRTEEADKVSVRIAKLLSEPAFSFNAHQYLAIHKYLFQDIYPHAGQIRTYNITKKEWILEGATVTYGTASELKATLEYDLEQERNFSYKNLSMTEIIEHLAVFISRLWQIHVFEEGNTRTTAVFFIKYLKTLGFEATNDIFAENAWYFRNALVRANYNNLAKNIYETNEFLILFIRNLLLNENHLLSNRLLHINPNQLPQKQDIKEQKQDIESLFANKTGFSKKTQQHIETLYHTFGGQVFSRADVINQLNLSASPSSELLRKMLENGIIENVKGLGKGKYRFI